MIMEGLVDAYIKLSFFKSGRICQYGVVFRILKNYDWEGTRVVFKERLGKCFGQWILSSGNFGATKKPR